MKHAHIIIPCAQTAPRERTPFNNRRWGRVKYSGHGASSPLRVGIVAGKKQDGLTVLSIKEWLFVGRIMIGMQRKYA
jgi:hypothetical protein